MSLLDNYDSYAVTVVTVCRNAGDKLDVTAASIAAQGRPDCEWLVVDGASTDDTVRRAEAWRERMAGPVRIVSEPDAGIYDAMNKGLRLARGGWVHFLNADDAYSGPDVLSQVVGMLRDASGDLMALYGRVRFIERGQGFAEEVCAGHTWWDFALSSAPHHQGVFMRTDAARRAGGFSARFGPAADLALIAALQGREPGRMKALDAVVVDFALGGVSENPDITMRREIARARAVGASLGLGAGLANFAYGVTLWARSWLRVALHRAGVLPQWRRCKARLFPGRYKMGRGE